MLPLLSAKTATGSSTSSSSWSEHTCVFSKSGSVAQRQNRRAEDGDPREDHENPASSLGQSRGIRLRMGKSCETEQPANDGPLALIPRQSPPPRLRSDPLAAHTFLAVPLHPRRGSKAFQSPSRSR